VLPKPRAIQQRTPLVDAFRAVPPRRQSHDRAGLCRGLRKTLCQRCLPARAAPPEKLPAASWIHVHDRTYAEKGAKAKGRGARGEGQGARGKGQGIPVSRLPLESLKPRPCGDQVKFSSPSPSRFQGL
jgi:hypothetical protein